MDASGRPIHQTFSWWQVRSLGETSMVQQHRGKGMKPLGYALILFFLMPSYAMAEKMRSAWYEAGSRTASGAPFNPDDVGVAAHRTLPLGTLLYAVNRKTGKSAFLKVKDRGPVSHKLQLDVSRGTAKKLGFFKAGIAMLDVVVLPK